MVILRLKVNMTSMVDVSVHNSPILEHTLIHLWQLSRIRRTHTLRIQVIPLRNLRTADSNHRVAKVTDQVVGTDDDRSEPLPFLFAFQF